MKGLMIKDLMLLKNQKNFFVLFLIMAAFFLFSGSGSEFVLTYATSIIAYMVVGTLSYDEFNNGNAFLFTLPFKRKTYVAEKYVLGIGASLAAWAVITLAFGVVKSFREVAFAFGPWFFTCLIYLFIPVIVLALMLPVQLKYGAEKGRMATLVGVVLLTGLIAGGGFLAKRFANVDVDALLINISTLSLGAWLAILFGVTAIILTVSYKISERVICKKEF